ncbi:hypothetical protein AGMMS50262_22870 [Bacteroidia bacterium]|nr:hypothetical protein AGMMS50262_22870 [Bacteroidia bacterium]
MRTTKFTFIIFLLGLFTLPSVATDFYWRTNPVDMNFTNTANWVTDPAEIGLTGTVLPSKPTNYPTSSDNVHFTSALTANRTLTSTAVAQMDTLFFEADANFEFRFTINVYGNIQSNGKLQVTANNTGYVNMVGSKNATIDLGTDTPVLFGDGFTVNKPGAQVELVNHDLNLIASTYGGHYFTLTAGDFYSNGKNITVPIVIFSVVPVDLIGTILTLTKPTGTSRFCTGIYNCDIVSNNATIETDLNVQFKSLTLNHATATTIVPINPTCVFSIDNLIVNTPALSFLKGGAYNQEFTYSSITISDTLTLQRASNITVNANIYNPLLSCLLNVKGIKIIPTNCAQQSSLAGYGALTFKATGDPLTTANLTYKNINFDTTGATVTASEGDDGGQNSGKVVWTPETPQDFYWIGGTGQWNVPANWAIGSFAGTPATCAPTAIDNVFLMTMADRPIKLS